MSLRTFAGLFCRCLRQESGQDAIEYALITGVFSLTVISIFPPILEIFERRFEGISRIVAMLTR